jgi:hypothetical protein
MFFFVIRAITNIFITIISITIIFRSLRSVALYILRRIVLRGQTFEVYIIWLLALTVLDPTCNETQSSGCIADEGLVFLAAHNKYELIWKETPASFVSAWHFPYNQTQVPQPFRSQLYAVWVLALLTRTSVAGLAR